MVKNDMVKIVAKETGLKQVDVESVMNWTFRLMADSIQEEGRFEFGGFGVFKKVRRKATDRPNPQNRMEKIHTPARNTVKFKPAPALKTALNV